MNASTPQDALYDGCSGASDPYPRSGNVTDPNAPAPGTMIANPSFIADSALAYNMAQAVAMEGEDDAEPIVVKVRRSYRGSFPRGEKDIMSRLGRYSRLENIFSSVLSIHII